jgi:dihydroneopterin aldolase
VNETTKFFLENLRLKCKRGVTDEERREPQEVALGIGLIINFDAQVQAATWRIR